ncbi:N-6 DNA methylase [Algoriphagus pacificus]|jgi:type I restriction enzyme M protein|uniref:site-specific DNA-methyltransferase (adenine-specific) n=1 Tax=Algoriphagus pacificus TaxID=2811234 RepID=A0ABS3CID0_9BACT|nr:N-6 DNA methylase [Algoriphagus pacificus]MBN7816852.1 N-6 DNA methylase [Algoriphagus pacificus]
MAKKEKDIQEESIEKKLWKSADKLRKNMDAAEYKHVVLGLIFLKYISDAFEELYQKLKTGEGEYEGADAEDKNEYVAEKVFYVPPQARWSFLMGRAKQPTIGKDVDDAMESLEKDNISLKGVLPKVYAKTNLDKQSLGSLIDLIGTIALGDKVSRSKDVLGQIYEYFLGRFALAEGKKGGQFYTPRNVVELLVELIEPYEGRVFDPCCGSGGMFVQSDRFVQYHQDHYNAEKNKLQLNPSDRISIYGQESNETTWRLCKMNLAIRGIDSSNVRWNNEGSFLNDAHKDLKADFIIANPPFNDSDWSGELLRNDGRWIFGVPPASNANFAWFQHFLYHLSPNGVAGIVMHGGAASNKGQQESSIRKKIVEANLVDCIIALPTQLFYNTTLPVHIWILRRNKSLNKNYGLRPNEILMIDAYNLGTMIESTQRELSDEDLALIINTYHDWRNSSENYSDTPGFCKSVSQADITAKSFILAPNRYIDRIKRHREIPFKSDVQDHLATLTSYVNKLGSFLNSLDTQSDGLKENYFNAFDDSKYDKSKWVPTELNEIVDTVISGNWGNAEPKKNNIAVKVIRGTDLPNIPLFNLHKTPTRYISSDKAEEISLIPGDIVVEMSGGSKDQPTGRIGFITPELLDFFGMPLICSNFCKVIRLNPSAVNPYWFFYYWMLSYDDGLTTRYENQPSGIKNFQLDEYLDSEIILLPPDDVQQAISNELSILFDLKNKMNYTSSLLKNLMHKGFENIYYEFDK